MRKMSLVKLSLLVLCIVCSSGLARAQSANDGFDPNGNGLVRSLVAQADGKILVGGDFTMLGGATRNHIARLNSDGSLDTSFNPGADGNVYAIAVQADGKILAGGLFTQLGGQPRNFIGRLNADGSLDTSFNPGPNDYVLALAVQTDGKILVGGGFAQLSGQSRNRIGRLNADGSLDTGFNPGTFGEVRVIVMQSDGKILVAGNISQLGGQPRNFIGRVNSDGSLDTVFNPGANGTIDAIAVQTDGKILVGGFFTNLGGQPNNRIGRLNPDGSPETSFTGGADSTIHAIALQADGKILVGGSFTQLGGQNRNHIGRLNPTGSIDTSFSPGTNGLFPDVFALAVQADGKILVGGGFAQLNGQTRNFIGRLNPDGSLDASLNPGANNPVYAVAVQPDGKILVGGTFTQLGGQSRNRIGRLNSNGSLDTGFNPGANDEVDAITVQADGKILVGGLFTQIGGQNRNRVARLNSDGSLDTTFNSGANSRVDALVEQPDGKILVGGLFNQLGGQTRNCIGRLNPNGSLDTSFNTGADSEVASIAVQSDGKILVVGGFIQLGGQSHNRIGRLNPDGSLDNTFNPEANNDVFALAIQADGKILLGGFFGQLNGQGRSQIGRLNADGSLDTSFNPGTDGPVFTIAVQADGKILLGGFFLALNGEGRSYIGRLNSNGSLDTSFNPGAGQTVGAIVVQADGKILVGGFFINLGGQARDRIGRLTNTDAALQNLTVSPDGTTIQWLRSGASPELSRVTFEGSTNGINYFLIGSATRIAGGWHLTGQSLPRAQNIFIRARGFQSMGYLDGSGSVVESVRTALLPAVTSVCTGAPSNLISWWPGEGNFQDIVSNYDGIFSGATFGMGLVGEAFSLDGINDAIVINNNFGLNPTSITVEAWVNPDNAPVGILNNVVAKWGFDAARDGYLLGLLNDGSAIRVIGGIGDGATGDPGLFGGTVSLNSWSHIAMTYDAASGVNRLYLNGVQVNQRVRANGIYPTPSRVFIGSEDSNQGRFFSGLIDEPAIFSRALTDAEILAIYQAGSNSKCAALPTPTPTPTPSPGSPVVQFSASNYNVQEDCTTVTLTVNRVGDTSSAASVDYSTSNLIASERKDYITAVGKLQFGQGDTSKSLVVLINEDSYVEGNEPFTVTLSNPSGMTLGGPAIATVTITDDPSEPSTNVIDDPRNYVCQNYHDFLNRQPDSIGWDFWTNEITSCGSDAGCIEFKRINVSGAFYISIEFQKTGYLVERFYKVAYGDATGSSILGGAHQLPVPIVRFREFLLDTQRVSQGVVVNQPGWETVLENNKQAYAQEFVQSSRFTTALPTSLTPMEFVDQLSVNAGNVLSASERTTAINLFGGAGDTANLTARAQAVRQVAEDSDLDHAETNRAFVLMQFLGYLRRNPNDPQDTDYSGYDFWLGKLNEFNGNFVNAQMVKAFIVSGEYRNRFGP